MRGGGSKIWGQEGAFEMAKNLRLNEGFSFGRIADVLTVKFNTAVTRNAVIGKFTRMGIVGGPARPARRKTMKPRPTPWGGKSAFLKASTAKPKNAIQAALLGPPEPLPEAQPDDIARMSFSERDPKLHCGFIPGDPQEGDALHSKKYCGLPIVHGSPAPYCIDHLRRCHTLPPTPKSPRPFILYRPGVRLKEDA